MRASRLAAAGCVATALVSVLVARWSHRRREVRREVVQLKSLPASEVPSALRVSTYFDLEAAAARGCGDVVDYLRGCAHVSAALDGLHAFCIDALERRRAEAASSGWEVRAPTGSAHEIILAPGARVCEGSTLDASGGPIFLGPDTVVEPGALVRGPAIVGEGTVVRHGAYIRGDVVLGAGCVVGGELKHALALDHCELPHYGCTCRPVLNSAALSWSRV
jgi:hypothetical protein